MLQLLAPFLSSLANNHVQSTIRHTRNQIIIYIFLAFSAFFVIIFLNIIAYMLLIRHIEPILTVSVLCLFWLCIMLILLITLQIISLRRQKSYKKKMNEEKTTLMIASALALLPSLISHSKTLSIAAPLIGVASYFFIQSNKKDK